MLTASDVNILRATFKNQILNYINARIKKLEQEFAKEVNTQNRVKLKWRLKELHKVKGYIHTV